MQHKGNYQLRIKLDVVKKEQYKELPFEKHVRLFESFYTKGFVLTKYIRRRDNYYHRYVYELKFQHYVENAEVYITHDGYLDMYQLNNFHPLLDYQCHVKSGSYEYPPKLKIEVTTFASIEKEV